MNITVRRCLWIFLVAIALAPGVVAQQENVAHGEGDKTPADLVLTGEVKGAQNKTYFEIPFTVPARHTPYQC